MTLEERYEEIKQNVIEQTTDYSESMIKSYEFGKFINNFITNFDFSIIDEKDCCKFVDALGEGISFRLNSTFIKNVMENNISYPFCTKENLEKIFDICVYNCFGFYQRFNEMSPFVEDSIKEFIRGFKEVNTHYVNCVINYNNVYKNTLKQDNNQYPTLDIEIKLYKS